MFTVFYEINTKAYIVSLIYDTRTSTHLYWQSINKYTFVSSMLPATTSKWLVVYKRKGKKVYRDMILKFLSPFKGKNNKNGRIGDL